ncbi:MAG: tripartite tricarboxylate transporter substrate binding protein [Deltaproteobacteria bacterium]|jgi:tripartite-type tricarboxylate transporter receptor subunit TctC|nr:tripartite tricarboxylate transporter substrate binding protein [Deltaproteobacteria bacterium]MBT4637745.1 tripartite tricarboxylate transporter substrate binding protein [Deltaproteobacteria bacterium]MBT6499202.1 tripartite tricarboxylate transporter substrate binding protein [Deltaproteobacteria bacterium]MBT7714442.1 tripartite tricarboxylate transporter substrate binding protein [Deltaproteobacteria bacterium]MBT7890719.1 tripartite tricarboxylate transporter substrate binding protein 
MKNSKLVLTIKVLLTATIFLFVGSAAALAEYPDRPITMYIGYKAGGGTDTVGRVLAKAMGQNLGQQVNVVNKPGAGGGISTMAVIKAKPDGYTILLNPSLVFTFTPQVNKRLTYAAGDLDYAGTLNAYQVGLVAPAEAPYDTLTGLVNYAKSHSGITYATMNPPSAITIGLIAKKTGIKFNKVPVKGGAGMISVILGKQVDFSYSGGIHQRYPGKIKLLAALSSTRHAAFPNIPTAAEQGYPLSFDTFTTMAVPKGTPKSIIAKIERAMKAASKDTNVLKISEKIKFPMSYRTAAETDEAMQNHWNDFADLIKEVGYKAK